MTFTASEFGRTLQPNGNAGTDHAWGNHHFVIGTNARRGRTRCMAGSSTAQFPSLALGGPNDANTRGTLIPTTSVDQYAGDHGAVVRRDGGEHINGMFPYVGNFGSYESGVPESDVALFPNHGDFAAFAGGHQRVGLAHLIERKRWVTSRRDAGSSAPAAPPVPPSARWR